FVQSTITISSLTYHALLLSYPTRRSSDLGHAHFHERSRTDHCRGLERGRLHERGREADQHSRRLRTRSIGWCGREEEPRADQRRLPRGLLPYRNPRRRHREVWRTRYICALE